MSVMHDWLAHTARIRRARGLERVARIRVGDDVVDLASNDYLGLARDPRLVAAAHAAVRAHGTGARASRLVTGTTAAHEDCEEALKQLLGQPAALVTSSGYTANLAAVTSLTGPDCLLVTDEHIHASLIDAARLSRSPVVRTPHGDVTAVEDALAHRTQRRALVVVESIYSVLGDAADLAGLADMCERHDATLLVDEAHGVGVAGGGRGGVAAAGLAGAPHVFVTATLSKALGSQGGAVLGPPALRTHLVNTARAVIFDTALAPAAAAAAAQACRIITAEPDRVAGVARRATRVAAVCGVARAVGAVQSLPLGDATTAVAAAQELDRRGILVGCFRPPSVPDGISRLRICADSALPLDTVDRAAHTIAEVVHASQETA